MGGGRWDPGQYLRFAGLRERPGIELLARIPESDPSLIVDLGCGTGSLTSRLAERFPHALVTGVDNSPDMLERARQDHPDLHLVEGDIATWEPPAPVDLVFSNAALHWLDSHETLVPRLRSWLTPGGVLAIQMPNNWAAPTHRIPAEILDGPGWPDEARNALMRDRLATPTDYRRWVQPATVDLWETTYHQILEGNDPVLEWVSGSVLKPVLDRLSGGQRRLFIEECRQRYAAAYPPAVDGTTVLPFSRVFLVAQA